MDQFIILGVRPAKAFNPVAQPDSHLFTALMSGERAVHGFTNRDLLDKLTTTSVRPRQLHFPALYAAAA